VLRLTLDVVMVEVRLVVMVGIMFDVGSGLRSVLWFGLG